MGEESADLPGTSGLTWVLDPIDGNARLHLRHAHMGCPHRTHRCRGAGLRHHRSALYRRAFRGRAGPCSPHRAPWCAPACRGARAVAVRGETVHDLFRNWGTAQDRAGFEAVRDRVRLTRYGMDCYAYALVAAGHVDLVIEAGLHPYDICAPIAVIEAAGGVVTNWEGGPAHGGGRVLAASSPALHAEALALLSSAGRDVAPDFATRHASSRWTTRARSIAIPTSVSSMVRLSISVRGLRRLGRSSTRAVVW